MKKFQYLPKVNQPADVKKLDAVALKQLCQEIRLFLIQSISKTGGHLASNLGVVELSVALHKVFDSPEDKILWDVGHQSYTHKLLTGRRKGFANLRMEGGLSGFPKRSESVHDAFLSGHSSNSLSAAYGIATALQLDGDNEHQVVAVIGDGSFTGGMVYEALNNAGRSKRNLIVILNHNDMSISQNVGAISKNLSHMRATHGYTDFKKCVSKMLEETPVVGPPIKDSLRNYKSLVKRLVYNSTFFDQMGFEYMGAVDGHDLEELITVLEAAKRHEGPVVVHVDTKKGKGYRYAEQNPSAYHGVGAFDPKVPLKLNCSADDFSGQFGETLVDLAQSDDRICAITAAMEYGTGLHPFRQAFKNRFFDVGIAEQHAVTFAAGLAAQGKLPVFAVYSSFLQRSYDQLMHDCAIEPQHVVLAIDRAGIVGADGQTHQGIYDVSFLSSVPNTTIYTPENYRELSYCLKQALYKTPAIAAVRYPRGKETTRKDLMADCYRDYLLHKGSTDTVVVTYGRQTEQVMQAIEGMAKKPTVLKLLKVHPLPLKAIQAVSEAKRVLFVEEGSKQGGVGMAFLLALTEQGFGGRYELIAIDEAVHQAEVSRNLEILGLDAKSIRRRLEEEHGKREDR